jgi:hypothetical protein
MVTALLRLALKRQLARGIARLSGAALPGNIRRRGRRRSQVLKFLVSAAIFLLLCGCQMTRDREADSQREFAQAVAAQHRDIASVCARIQSDVQRRRCLGE